MRKNKKPASKTLFDINNLDHLDRLRGLLKVELSPLTQTFVGCRLGDNIEMDKSWIYVDKEKILDHVEFYNKDSEFFPILSDVSKFPNEKILIGTYQINLKDKIKYYICGTLNVEKSILNAQEKCNKSRRNKALKSICVGPRKWRSLGSEYAVDCEILKSIRPLLIVELDGCMPILKTKTKFVMRNVESLRDGYMELLNSRSSYNSILRKRMDTGVQSIPSQRSIAVQATFRYMCHRSIQCSNELLTRNLHNFSFKLDELNDMLKVNYHINLYKDDYKVLQTSYPKDTVGQSTKLKSYQDVLNCRRSQISCLSWNAIISGILAAAHTTKPIFIIERSRPTINTDFDALYNEHLVLIWEYQNNLYPKFYLHASKEVTALSFCPYDVNILVGGCSNGQIVVWDLNGRLDFSEPREFLTDVEQGNHLMIMKETSWFKPPLEDNHIHPLLCCTLLEGHSEAVTTIGWIPPSKYISGQRIYRDSEPNMPHMQFITASLDGKKILVWDLKIPDPTKSAKKKKVRLPGVSLSLRDTSSPLHVLKNKFNPVCRLNLKDLGLPITRVLVQRHTYCYVAQNPSTLNNINKPTYFKVSENNAPFDYSRTFYITTGVGTIHEITWEATDFDAKYCAINEKCSTEKCYDVHDGPILVCEANPCLPNVVLTIGGSIVAIWTLKESKIPIFWRKFNVRCITGMWFFLNPLAFLVVRSDRFYELWNICERSDAPIKSFKYNGYDMTKLYQDTSRLHVQKNTYVITDIAGAFQLYTVPSQYSDNVFNIKEAIGFLNRLNTVKKNVEQLKNNFRKKHIEIKELSEIAVAEPRPENNAQPEVPLQKQMQKEEGSKKTLSFLEVSKLCARRASKKINREKKLTEKLGRRKEIFEKAKGKLFVEDHSKYVEKSSKVDSKEIKDKYFIEYKKLEQEVIEKVNNEPYILNCDWAMMLRNRGKK